MRRFFISLLFVLAGVGLIGFGIYRTYASRNYVETTAVIDQVEDIYTGTDDNGTDQYNHIVYVNYTVNGQYYSSQSDSYHDDYVKGKEITVFYNPNNPAVISGDSNGFGVYMIIAGAVSALAGVAIFVKGNLQTA